VVDDLVTNGWNGWLAWLRVPKEHWATTTLADLGGLVPDFEE
jgi:hypothetical protein